MSYFRIFRFPKRISGLSKKFRSFRMFSVGFQDFDPLGLQDFDRLDLGFGKYQSPTGRLDEANHVWANVAMWA